MAGNKIVSCSCVVLLISMMIINVNAGLVLGTRINNINIRKILAVASRAEQAYNAGDLDTLVSLYTEDCRIFFPQRPEQRGQEGQPASSYIAIRNLCVYLYTGSYTSYTISECNIYTYLHVNL